MEPAEAPVSPSVAVCCALNALNSSSSTASIQQSL
jgi:hypothetical protein